MAATSSKSASSGGITKFSPQLRSNHSNLNRLSKNILCQNIKFHAGFQILEIMYFLLAAVFVNDTLKIRNVHFGIF